MYRIFHLTLVNTMVRLCFVAVNVNEYLMMIVVTAWMSDKADAGKSALHFMSVGHFLL